MMDRDYLNETPDSNGQTSHLALRPQSGKGEGDRTMAIWSVTALGWEQAHALNLIGGTLQLRVTTNGETVPTESMKVSTY